MSDALPSAALHRALTEEADSAIGPLPSDVERLLVLLNAPPRLAAHLRIVHGVAGGLASWLFRTHPGVDFKRDAVLFGAATHDVGKIVHRHELSGPGSAHEVRGWEDLGHRFV